MTERYFVIDCSDDGDVHLEVLTKQELETRLNDNYWGDAPDFLSATPDAKDLAAESGLYIIKGELIEPQPRFSVRAWAV